MVEWIVNLLVVIVGLLAGSALTTIAPKTLGRVTSRAKDYEERYRKYVEDRLPAPASRAANDDSGFSIKDVSPAKWPELPRPIRDYVNPEYLTRPLHAIDFDTIRLQITAALKIVACYGVFHIAVVNAPTGSKLEIFIVALLFPPVFFLLSLLALRFTREASDPFSIHVYKHTFKSRQAPIFYLRSFRRDGAFDLEQEFEYKLNPEATLCQSLKQVAPVVAIGDPGSTRFQRGAARVFLKDEHWKAFVGEFIEISNLVVYRVDTGDGVEWEFDRVLEQIGKKHIVLLLIDGSGFPYGKEDYESLCKRISAKADLDFPVEYWNSWAFLITSDLVTKGYRASIDNTPVWHRGKSIVMDPATAFLGFTFAIRGDIEKLLVERGEFLFRKSNGWLKNSQLFAKLLYLKLYRNVSPVLVLLLGVLYFKAIVLLFVLYGKLLFP